MKKLLMIACLLYAGMAHPAVPPSSMEKAYFPVQNLLTNPGFELGKTGWTASGGTFTITTTAANVGTGARASSWDSSAASQTFTSGSVTVPSGWYGANGVLRCRIQTPSGTATHTMGLWDGTTLVNATTITSNTNYQATSVNMVLPSSGTIAIRISSVAANEPSINIDDCYLGLADNVGTVSQTLFVGSAYIAQTASCNPTTTSATLVAFPTTSACPGPTVLDNPGPGIIQTTDTDLIKFTVNSLEAARYRVIINLPTNLSSSSGYGTLAINDGTNSRGEVHWFGENNTYTEKVLIADFSYTSAGNRSFELFGSVNTGNLSVRGDAGTGWTGTGNIRFSIIRLPSISEQAVRMDQTDFGWTSYTPTFEGLGTVSSVSAWYMRKGDSLYVRGTATVGTTTAVALTVSLPGSLTVDYTKWQTTSIARTGTLSRLVNTGAYYGSESWFMFPDGTTTTKIFAAKTAGAGPVFTKTNGNTSFISGEIVTFDFGPIPIVGWVNSAAAPLIVGGITSSSTGTERLERAYINNSAGTCSITSQSGTWISSISHPGTGQCTLTFASGYFSSAPSCVMSQANNNTGTAFSQTDATTSSITVGTNNNSDAASDRPFTIHCMGAR